MFLSRGQQVSQLMGRRENMSSNHELDPNDVTTAKLTGPKLGNDDDGDRIKPEHLTLAVAHRKLFPERWTE